MRHLRTQRGLGHSEGTWTLGGYSKSTREFGRLTHSGTLFSKPKTFFTGYQAQFLLVANQSCSETQ